METIRIRVNGESHHGDVEASLLLIDWLRDARGLHGTRAGCDTTRCGACMVLLDGLPVKSCTLLAVQAHDGEIETVEGLEARGEHPIRKALREAGATVCDVCVTGRIVVGEELLRRKKRLTEGEVVRALASNRCTCRTVSDFVAAVLRVAGGD